MTAWGGRESGVSARRLAGTQQVFPEGQFFPHGRSRQTASGPSDGRGDSLWAAFASVREFWLMVLHVASQTTSIPWQLAKSAAPQTSPQSYRMGLHFSRFPGSACVCVVSIEQHWSVSLGEEEKPQTPTPGPVLCSQVLTKLGWTEFTFKGWLGQSWLRQEEVKINCVRENKQD